MAATEKNARTYLLRFLLVAFILVVVGYALFELRHLMTGPIIAINYPQNGATVSDSLIEVRGTTRNVAWLTLNDRQIFVDSKGNLKEELLLAPGYNILLIKAQDRFGRSTQERVEVIVTEAPHATSTAVSETLHAL